MSRQRTEASRLPDDTPAAGESFYTITPEDIGRHLIRTSLGVTIDTWETYGMGEAVEARDVGTRLYGMPNRGSSGDAWYWTTEEPS